MKENGFILEKPPISQKYDIFSNEPNTYYKQLNILLAFYNNFNKGFDEVIAILNRRRNVGTPIGTPMPVNEFVILCNKLKEKYNIDPLENMGGFGNFKYILDNLNKKDSDIKYYKQMLDIYSDKKLLELSSINNYFIFKKYKVYIYGHYCCCAFGRRYTRFISLL